MSGKAACPLVWKFLECWPNAESARRADPNDIAQLMRPLGLHETRARRIIKMSSKMVWSSLCYTIPQNLRFWMFQVITWLKSGLTLLNSMESVNMVKIPTDFSAEANGVMCGPQILCCVYTVTGSGPIRRHWSCNEFESEFLKSPFNWNFENSSPRICNCNYVPLTIGLIKLKSKHMICKILIVNELQIREI